MIGGKYGRLTLVKFIRKNSVSQQIWLVRCDCGTEKEVKLYKLRSGHTQSCGCLRIDNITKHGLSRTTTYKSWESLNTRCNAVYGKDADVYGSKDITVCTRWYKFENFLDDMGERPEGMSIDRIDNSKGYYKENCRWATDKEQARNRSSNKSITYRGETRILVEWAEVLKINYNTLRARIYNGWSVERAFTEKVY